MRRHGSGNWNVVQKNTGLARCGKSCRLRWTNHLRPDLKRGAFTDEEQRKVVELHALMGNKWAKMAQEVSISSSFTSHIFYQNNYIHLFSTVLTLSCVGLVAWTNRQ